MSEILNDPHDQKVKFRLIRFIRIYSVYIQPVLDNRHNELLNIGVNSGSPNSDNSCAAATHAISSDVLERFSLMCSGGQVKLNNSVFINHSY